MAQATPFPGWPQIPFAGAPSPPDDSGGRPSGRSQAGIPARDIEPDFPIIPTVHFWIPVLIAVVFVAGIGVGLGWRRLSRRKFLPCPAWLAWLVERDNPLARENRADRIVERLGLESGMKVLDAGCGPGRLTVPLAQAVGRTGEVTALDMQSKMLDRALEKTRREGFSNVLLYVARLGPDALPAGEFDRAVLVTVLGEIPDQADALKSLFGALKPGGILSVTETVFDPHYQRRSKVKRLGASAGFRIHAVFGNWLAYTLQLKKP